MPSTSREVKNETNRRYYQRNKERILAKAKLSSKDFYDSNRVEILSRAKKSREKHYEKSLFRQVKSRCERNGIPFNIDLSDIVIPEFCPLLKVKLTRTQGQGRVDSNASVDRINPSLGYTKGNIQILSLKANTMKQNASQEELETFARSILEIKEILK